jgi:hypothetical protein
MLSQGHMGAPLYRYTSQVGPRFGNSRSLVECKNGAIMSRLRLISTSDCFPHPHQMYTKCLSLWYSVSYAYGCTLIPLRPAKLAPDLGTQGHLVSKKWCHNIMVEADIHFRPLHTSILGICRVFELLVCCLKGIWLQPYTITPTRLAPRSENEAITSWLRLISTSDCFRHP